MVTPKVPREPRHPLPDLRPTDLVEWTQPLVRVARTTGTHLVPWNGLRTFGPIGGMRWEPHPAGAPGHHPGHGVSYQSEDLTTCIAEVFQTTRRIDPSTGSPAAYVWTPTHPLRLLDVVGTWPLRAGGSAALSSAPRPTCCAWARAIHAAYPDLDGLRSTSTMTGSQIVVLFSPAADAFPPAPDAVVPLDSDVGLTVLESIANSIEYRLG